MEIGSVGASNKGVLVSQSTTSDAILSDVLTPLKTSFLCEESEKSFKYTSALLINNAQQEIKYNAFREKKRELGYTEEDLKESFGFLLFDDINKAKKLGETGVLVGNSTCKTLGDPTKGVYICQYSDRLDQQPWSHGKSGYIAIIRLTKGRVKKVSEKYTQSVAAPTQGFDCHSSKEFSAVLSHTSSFLAFQRTQCYLYEFVGDGSDETVQCPSAAFLYAIVSFSYNDPKLTLITAQKSEQRELGRCYFPWTGQLLIGLRYYRVGLRATAGALIPAELATVVKVDRVISVSDLRRVLPKAIFQTRFFSEVFLGGLYYSLCELVSSEVEQANALNLLLQEIKAKDVALTVPLNDSGFLILLPSSYFCNYDSGSGAEEILQGIFVFPQSRLIRRDNFPSKEEQRRQRASPEIRRVSPGLRNAELAAQETSVHPGERLSGAIEQPPQRRAAASAPGMVAGPQENGLISDGCGVADPHGPLSSVPEWTSAAWQNFSSYLRKPDSFQIPVSKTPDVLFAGQEKKAEDIVDGVSQSVPEKVPGSHVNPGVVGCLTSQNSAAADKTRVDGSTEGQTDVQTSPQSVKLGDLLMKSGDMEAKSSTSPGDLRAELIVSITSAEPTVSGSHLVDSESPTKCHDVQLSGFQAKMSEGEGKETAKKDRESSKKACRGTSRGVRPPPKACQEPEHKHKDGGASNTSQLHVDVNSSEAQTRKFGKLLKNKKLKSAAVALTPAEEKKSDGENLPMKLEVCGIRRKMEHWDLKPVVSKCGRILVPHGSGNIVEQIRDLRTAAQSGNDRGCEERAALSAKVEEARGTEPDVERENAAATPPVDEDGRHGGVDCPARGLSQAPHDETKGSSLDPQSSGSKSAEALPQPVCLPPENPARRMETLISKLKSVLRGKRKSDLWEDMGDGPESVELCLKRGKLDADLGSLKSAVEASGVPDAAAGKAGLSTLLSVDPSFAFALGLTPRAMSKKMVSSQAGGVQRRKEPAEAKAVSDGQRQIMQSPLSIFPQRRRVKALQKHQGSSAENVKDKWWLRFQSSKCVKSEDLPDKVGRPGRRPAEQRTSTVPTDGLNLLADLALCAAPDQLPPQPEQAQGRRPKNSSSVAEQESVLHALLRQPAARPPQSVQSSPAAQNLRDGQLAGLITKEHAYSMHPSTSLLLDFSTMPFQIYPLSGGTRLLHRHQTQNLALDQEDKSSPQTPECTEIRTEESKRWRHSRSVAVKDGAVQVTKRWRRSYDFGRDSKFSNEPRCRTVCRALHGPWDFSVKDTIDEVRLIFHLWVALFYSRSTPRFFELDSEPSCRETLPGSVPDPPLDDVKKSSFAPDPDVKERSDASISAPSDPSTNEIHIWDQRPLILDLSKKNSSSDVASSLSPVVPMETCETPNTPVELHPKAPFQRSSNVYSSDMVGKVSAVRSAHDSETHSTAGVRSSSALKERGDENTRTRLLDGRDEGVSGVREEKHPSQEASAELVPQLIRAGNVPSGVVNNGDLFGKEKRVRVKKLEAFSPAEAGDAGEGVGCRPSEGSVSQDLNAKGDVPSSHPRAGVSGRPSQVMSASGESAENVTENHHPSLQERCLAGVLEQRLSRHDGPDVRNEPGSDAEDSRQREAVADEPCEEKAAFVAADETSGVSDESVPRTNGDAMQEQSRTVEDLRCSLTAETTREGLEVDASQAPDAGEPTRKEDAAQAHEPGSGGGPDGAGCQEETASSQPADTQKGPCLQKEKPGLSGGKVSPSLYDERCPTPTLDEEPYQYTPPSAPGSSGTSSAVGGGETLRPESPKPPGQISALLKPETAADKSSKAVKAVGSEVNAPPSAPAVGEREDEFLSAQMHTEERSQTRGAGEREPAAMSAGQSAVSSHSAGLSDTCLQPVKHRPAKPLQSSAEVPSCSQAPAMPANAARSEKARGQSSSRDRNVDSSKPKPAKTSAGLQTSGLSGKRKEKALKTENLEELHEQGQLNKGTREWQTRRLSSVKKSILGRRNGPAADLLHQFKGQDASDVERVVQMVGNEPRNVPEMNEEPMCVDNGGEALAEDTFRHRARGQLRCTIFNSGQKQSSSFLERMSQRCLQEDLTQASVEEECLIFSQHMRQVLKRSRDNEIRVPTPDTPGHSRLFRSSSAAVHKQEDADIGLDSPTSFVGLKITVDVSDRTPQPDLREEDTSSWVKPAGVPRRRTGGARRDAGKTDGVCPSRKDPVRHQDTQMDSGDPKTGPAHLSNPGVKRESFHKNRKSVVKSCSQAKHRFYILVTADDPCFEETKVQLEAEGHTAVQPSEFFLAEEGSSTLLIILRNEDIAEHICEVPYLLSLKKSPGVQFAGIDEPDDVVNQTHQELFVSGGFVMLDRAALESLRLRDMKILSEILQELSRSGRWKWFLHYRHSRWLTEKSRLSGEAREKKNFISWCQEAGILEVLPYHECDRLSRDQPDYLTCLVRLQVQNVSARYPIFITESTTNSSFGTNGILTLTLSSFLTCKTSLV